MSEESLRITVVDGLEEVALLRPHQIEGDVFRAATAFLRAAMAGLIAKQCPAARNAVYRLLFWLTAPRLR